MQKGFRMRLLKFLSVIVTVTFFSLLYVWQQTEIFRLAYEGQRRQAAFQTLLDKNTVLRYNIERNASLVRIGDKVSAVKDFQMPDAWRLVRLAQPVEESKRPLKQAQEAKGVLANLFGLKRQAEARTINP